ncbi:MAG: hypothetical protein LBT32_07710 [Peptococcaceae bacterium]|nr:hypothetical protein [Peptococcaceae bacterium]
MTVVNLKKKVNGDEIRKVNVMTDRLNKLKKDWEDATPQVYVDDSVLFTESWKETEGQPIDIRWAKALYHKLANCPILIRDQEIIVGSLTKYIRGANTFVAMKPREILNMCKTGRFDRKLSDTASNDISPEELAALQADAEYWVEHMPKKNPVNEALAVEFGDDAENHFNAMFDRVGIFEGRAVRVNPDRGLFQGWSATGGGNIMVTTDVVNHGLNYIIDQAKTELAKMKKEGAGQKKGPAINALRKFYLLKSLIICCEACIVYAQRHATLARELAAKESNPQRQQELLKIADVCDNVPANPPRDFHEAVQCMRFHHLIPWKESSDRPEVGVGRLDKMFYPYYQKDLEAGTLTRQDAAELLGALWLKIRETEQLVTIKREHRAAPGTLLPDVTISGKDEKGNDLTNEISWLILEVMRQTKLSEPAIYVRWFEGIDEEFVLHALDCNRDFGGGNPAFLNFQMGVDRYLDRGVSLDDAVNWSASGCLGYHLDSAEHVAGSFSLNNTKIFELVLFNGVDPKTGTEIGLKTGDITAFTSIEQIEEAFYKQLDYFADRLRTHYFIWWSTEMQNGPMSGLRAAMQYQDCIPAGCCSREGGAKYTICRQSWIGDRGITDISDSLAAIKYLVFDKKTVTMAEMLDALKTNFAGKEELRQQCLNAPKYGNDDDYVDEILDRVMLTSQKILTSRPDPLTGEKPFLFKGAAAGHVTQGAFIGALPNGRLAYGSLNDCATSAMPGVDINGPTALILSATKGPYAYDTVGFTHNMKFNKDILNTPEKMKKLSSIISTFMKRGGWHIQFNIHDAQELVEAKKDPVTHKNLLVRVGGYSAYFVDLPPELQDEIITRTMHEVI